MMQCKKGRDTSASEHERVAEPLWPSTRLAPKIRRFAVGDFVYVQHSSETPSLGVKARAEILRVHKLGEKGALTLIGKDGGTVSVNATNCAPCHLPGIDGTIQLGLSPIPKEAPCVTLRTDLSSRSFPGLPRQDFFPRKASQGWERSQLWERGLGRSWPALQNPHRSMH